MSHRNKQVNKSYRAYLKTRRITVTAERVPVSELPLDINTKLLCEPGNGDRANRRALLAARGRVVLLDKREKRDFAIKNALKLAKLPLSKVIRELQRTARRAATCKYAAEKQTLGSTLRETYEAAQARQLRYLKQVSAEITARKTHAETV